ncbi:MAG: hypothetical protein ACFFGZ_06260 [Candidatus Thorarchaeota archaeon]
MTLTASVSKYCKTVGLRAMFILPALIVILLALAGFETDNALAVMAAVIWFLLFLNSVILSLNSILLNRDFILEVDRKAQQGLPVESLEGFGEIKRSVSRTLQSTAFITAAIFASLVIYLTGSYVIEAILDDPGPIEDTRSFVIFASIGLAFVGIAITLMLRLPDRPAMEPGAFIGHFSPSQVPCQIDNLLSDTVVPFLDPITRLRYDEWEMYLLNSLRDEFLSDKDPITRLEVAREKVLLLVYLFQRMPEIITYQVAKNELEEVIREDAFVGLFEGHESGISWQILSEIIRKIRKEAPEIFMVIDRVLIDLRENISVFKNKNLWVTVGAPSTVSGTEKPFRFLVFSLNLDPEFRDNKRPMKFILGSQEENPPFAYNLHLDESDDLGLAGIESLEFSSSEGLDVVGLLSQILQIGDAVWFQVYRSRIGKHIFRVSLEEPGQGAVYGSSLTVSIVRDLGFYARAYGGRLSALAGIALPFLGAFVGL